jgi:hypothetical protein
MLFASFWLKKKAFFLSQKEAKSICYEGVGGSERGIGGLEPALRGQTLSICTPPVTAW